MAVTPAKRLTRARNKPKKYDIEQGVESGDDSYPDFDALMLSSSGENEKSENSVQQRGRKSKGPKAISALTEEPDFLLATDSPAKKNRSSLRPKRNLIDNNSSKAKTPLSSAAKVDIPDVDFSTKVSHLYESLAFPNCNIRSLCDDWIDEFKQNSANSIYELISLVMNAAGCNFFSQLAFQQLSDDCTEAMNQFEEAVLSSKDLLLQEKYFESKSKNSKKFLQNYSEFWSCLVERAFNSILVDEAFLPDSLLWISTMTTSHIRSIRHASTVAILSLISGFCKSVEHQKFQLETVHKIKNSASKKQSRSKTNKSDEIAITKTIEFCQEMIDQNFNAVFVHRHRDVDSKIRTDCIRALGTWCNLYPSKFLNNAYLRYLGSELADPKSVGREEAVEIIQSLFEYPEHHMSLKPFIKSSKSRLIEMALYDEKDSIKVCVLNLIYSFLSSSLFPVKDWIESLKYLIFHANPKIRFAASKLVEIYLVESDSFTLNGFCKFLVDIERENSADIIFELYSKNCTSVFSVQNLVSHLLNENRDDSLIEIYFGFLLCQLKKSGISSDGIEANTKETKSVDSSEITNSEHCSTLTFSELIQLIKANRNYTKYLLQIIECLNVSLFLESMPVFKTEILMQLFDVIENSDDRESIRLGIGLLCHFKNNSLLSMEVSPMIDEFISGILGNFIGTINNAEFNWQTVDFDLLLDILYRIECILTHESIDVSFLFSLLEKLFTTCNLSEEHENFAISCLNCLFKFLVYDGDKNFSSNFIDVCTLALNCSLPSVIRTSCSLLVDHFLLNQTTNPTLFPQIASFFVNAFTNESSIDELVNCISSYSKMLIFQFIPAKGYLNHLLAIEYSNDKIEMMINCVMEKLLENSGQMQREVLSDMFDGLERLCMKGGSTAVARTDSIVSLLCSKLENDFPLREFHEKMYHNFVEKKTTYLFDMYGLFVAALSKQDASYLLDVVHRVFDSRLDMFESDEELEYFTFYVSLLKEQSKAKRGRKPLNVEEHESMFTSVADIPTDNVQMGMLSSETNENPFASSPNLK